MENEKLTLYRISLVIEIGRTPGMTFKRALEVLKRETHIIPTKSEEQAMKAAWQNEFKVLLP